MTILVIHLAVLILYGMIVWNSMQQGREAARPDDPDPTPHGTAQPGEGPAGN